MWRNVREDAYGEYQVRKVHQSGSYVLPMPEGKDIKKVVYRAIRQHSTRERIRIEDRGDAGTGAD